MGASGFRSSMVQGETIRSKWHLDVVARVLLITIMIKIMIHDHNSNTKRDTPLAHFPDGLVPLRPRVHAKRDRMP